MTNGDTKTMADVKTVASEALATLDTGGQIAPFSAHLPAFDLEDAYRVTAEIRQMREARGEMPWDERLDSPIGRFGQNIACIDRCGVIFTTVRYTTSP